MYKINGYLIKGGIQKKDNYGHFLAINNTIILPPFLYVPVLLRATNSIFYFMKIQKVNIGFSHYADANLQTKAENILLSLQGNASFAATLPTVADFQTAVNAYSKALYAATNRSRDNIAVKNQTRAALVAMLAQLGMSVMNIANGDVTMLKSSGFTLTKSPAASYISNLGTVTLSNGITSGELVAAIPRVPGAQSYLYEIAPDPLAATTDWQSTPATRSKYVFTNLEAGKKYWVRAAAIGAGGQIAYGPASAQFVQ